MPHMRAWGEQQAAMHKANGGGGNSRPRYNQVSGRGRKGERSFSSGSRGLVGGQSYLFHLLFSYVIIDHFSDGSEEILLNYLDVEALICFERIEPSSPDFALVLQ